MLGRRVVVVVAALIVAALCLASYGTALAGQRPATPAGRGPAGVAASGTVRGGWLAARSTGTAEYGPVSCAPGVAGRCTMVGANTGGDGIHALVATAKAGALGPAKQIPGTVALSTGSDGVFVTADTLSCPAAGDCLAAGSYFDKSNFMQVYVAGEVKGAWHKAVPVPGLAKLNTVGTVISCAAPGYCALGGSYHATSGGYDLPFIDSEVNGTWGAAEAVPGRPVTRGNYGITAISCPGAGDCVAAGNDNNGSYTITQQGSGWSKAAAVSGLGWVEALSCPAVGRCVAGGATSFGYGGFAATATERGGTWGKADLVPGAKAFTYKGKHATSSEIQGLSCPAAGYCLAGGDFFVSVNDSTAHSRGLVVSETAGTWGTARIPPGLAGLDSTVSSEIMYVACAAPATCVAIGIYDPSESQEDGFLSAELPRQPTRTALRLSLAHVIPGKEQAAKITVSVTAHGSTPGAVPAGKVTVRAGSTTVCVIKLTAGAGKAAGGCRLTPRELKPGTYRVAATYPGSGPFESSASAASVLTVA